MGRRTADSGKSKNNMSTPQWGGHNTFLLPYGSKILSKDFFAFRKNSRWPPKVAKIETFQFCIEYFPTTLWVKNSVQISLSLTVSEILRLFHKNSRWPPKVSKIEFFLILYRILFYYPVSQKFCPNRSISYWFLRY